MKREGANENGTGGGREWHAKQQHINGEDGRGLDRRHHRDSSRGMCGCSDDSTWVRRWMVRVSLLFLTSGGSFWKRCSCTSSRARSAAPDKWLRCFVFSIFAAFFSSNLKYYLIPPKPSTDLPRTYLSTTGGYHTCTSLHTSIYFPIYFI